MSPAAAHVTVRMYEVGFGDCFLLTFPTTEGARRVLIDCGHHAAGPPLRHPFPEVVDHILADIAALGGHLDVVVCSHRHRDHVYGFERPGWKDVKVDEVWMPWTEDPDDPEARSILEAQARKAKLVALALAASRRNDDDAARARALLDNNLQNAKAMATLHAGFTGVKLRLYLPRKVNGKPKRVMKPGVLPGVTVHVLGPGRDRATIRDMDPPVEESYFRMDAGRDGGGVSAALADKWSISPRGEKFHPWFKGLLKQVKGLALDPLAPLSPADPLFVLKWLHHAGLSLDDVRRVEAFAEETPLAAAAAIEDAVNGTSLMLAFEMGQALLLFPGDAQWGTWKAAVHDARALLERTTFLKVGHHGSHNASPRLFVEGVLGSGAQAMVSTRPTKLYKNIPRLPLLDRLKEKKARLARSDATSVAAPFEKVDDFSVEAHIPI